MPFEGAIHDHQVVCPPEMPARRGSPGSAVAFEIEPPKTELGWETEVLLAKLSLVGCANAPSAKPTHPKKLQHFRTTLTNSHQFFKQTVKHCQVYELFDYGPGSSKIC